MEKALYTLDDKVDYYLHKISMAPTLRLSLHELYEVTVLDEETYLIDQIMLEKGLLKIEKETRVITSKGLEISNFGGWALHQRLLKRDRQPLIPKEDLLIEKYEEEIQNLKNEILSLRDEVKSRKDKENTAYRIVNNLNIQLKTDKLYYLLGGIAVGFTTATLIWLFLK